MEKIEDYEEDGYHVHTYHPPDMKIGKYRVDHIKAYYRMDDTQEDNNENKKGNAGSEDKSGALTA